MRISPYNPEVHSNIIRNMRGYWKAAKQNEELTLTDEEIYKVFEDGYFDDASTGPGYEEFWISMLREAQQQKKAA